MDTASIAGTASIMKSAASQQSLSVAMMKQAASQQQLIADLLEQNVRQSPQPSAQSGFNFSTYA